MESQMESDRWKRLWELFHEALERDPSERAAFLAQACGSRADLIQRLEHLLTAHEHETGGDILDRPLELAGKSETTETAGASHPGEGQIAPGEVLAGRFRIERFLGQGGMGSVYEAHDQKLDVAVALKLMLPSIAGDEKAHHRFQREITMAREVTHPNACRIFDLFTHNAADGEAVPILTMELLQGETLAARLGREGPLSQESTLPIARDVAAALAAAHRVGVVHRDLKPANVMLVPEGEGARAVVMDFGLARRAAMEKAHSTRTTGAGQILGTPSYMAPEQLRDAAITPAADVYALGLLIYEMVTNDLPHQAKTPFAAAMKRLQERAPSPRKLCPELDRHWEGAILRCLERDPDDRFQSTEEVTATLEGDHVVAFPRRARRRLVWGGVAAVVLATLALLAGPRLFRAPAPVPVRTLITGLDNRTSEPVLDGSVEYARERELNQSRVPDGLTLQQLATFPASTNLSGNVSGDGRLLSYIDWTAGNVALYELETGTSRLLTGNTSWNGIPGWAEISVLDGPGRRVAYSWFNEQGLEFYDLRVVNVDGSDLRVVYRDASTPWIQPYAWSPDGQEILACLSDGSQHLGLVPVDGGTVHRLRTWDEYRCPQRASFSADGRFAAFDLAQSEGAAKHDILVIELDTKHEMRLVDHPADDRLMGWSPDGVYLLFTSDRTSRRALWALEIAGGEPMGEPQMVSAQFAGGPAGFGAKGEFYFGLSTTTNDVRLAALDLTGTAVVEEPIRASSGFVGATAMADWSRDGTRLVYRVGENRVQEGPGGPGQWAFAFFSPDTGQERIVRPQPPFPPGKRLRGPRLSPDGTQLAVAVPGPGETWALHLVDVATGRADRLTKIDPETLLTELAWSPDGRWLYYGTYYEVSGQRRETAVTRIDVMNGSSMTLHRGAPGGHGLDVSPEGETLAFWSGPSLVTMPVGGGAVREILVLESPERSPAPAAFVAWAANGRHLLFPKRGKELWRVRIATGRQERIALPVRGRLTDVAVHPDGERLAFTEWQESTQLWVLQNLASLWRD